MMKQCSQMSSPIHELSYFELIREQYILIDDSKPPLSIKSDF